MDRKRDGLVPAALPIVDALGATDALTRLRDRIDDSNRRYAAILDLLPAALAPLTRPGPVDENGFTLLAAHPAAAAKLRHLQPLLEARLAERGWQVSATRVRVQSMC